jgi:hypothetical protein
LGLAKEIPVEKVDRQEKEDEFHFAGVLLIVP